MMQPLKILLCSANMGNACPDDSLSRWIPKNGEKEGISYDILVVGMQEATFNKKRLKVGSKESAAGGEAEAEAVPPNEKFSNENPSKEKDTTKVEKAGPSEDDAPTAGSVGSDLVQPKKVKAIGKKIRTSTSHLVGKTQDALSRMTGNLSTDKDWSVNNFMKSPPEGVRNMSYDTTVIHGALEGLLPTYTPVVRHQRGEMRLMVFCLPSIVERLTGVSVAAENTGLGGIGANKGGIAARLEIDGTLSLSFITCHLEAHEGKKHYQGRMDNLEEILEGTKCGPSMGFYDVSQVTHHTFLMGDLNFRTDFGTGTSDAEDVEVEVGEGEGDACVVEISTDKKEEKERIHMEKFMKASDLVEKNDYEGLLTFDELGKMLTNEEAMVGWESLEPTFKPTFKVIKGKDTTEYNEQRIPSYTDRILFTSLDGMGDNLRPIEFGSAEGFSTSDHKPVFGSFEIDKDENFTSQIMPEPPKKQCSESKLSCTLTFSDIKCRNLTEMDPAILGGGSDPYVEFSTLTSKFMELPGKKMGQLRKKWPKTDTIIHNLDPDFPDRVVLTVRVKNEDELRGKFLVLTVWDKDDFSVDDVIGSCVINCERFVDAMGVVEFNDLPLIRFGKKHGTISFKVDIYFPEDFGSSSRFSLSMRTSLSMKGVDGLGGCCVVS